MNNLNYGVLDASYKAAGEYKGIASLCSSFYDNMSKLDIATNLRAMHGDDLTFMTEKLTLFLVMWLGGPKTYRDKYGFKTMPKVHEGFVINETERDTWLYCMDLAIEQQNFELSFKTYLKKQFRFPAEMIFRTSRKG